MIYELQPFNQARFDACMAWVAKEFNRTLTQYEAVKVHALADVMHVVDYHRPIIGGVLKKLKHGPVNLHALNRAKSWGDDNAAPLQLANKTGNSMHFVRKSGPTKESMFTESERRAILEAAKVVFEMTFSESQNYFHGKGTLGQSSYIGKAWDSTNGENAPISWETILNAYAKVHGEQKAACVRDLICI